MQVTQRSYSILHLVEKAPICEECQSSRFHYCDPACDHCHEVLLAPSTTIGHLFAVIRQWAPQIQSNILLIGRQIILRGAHPDDRDGLTDMTLLHYCCKAGCQGMGSVENAVLMAEELLKLDCDINIKCRWTQMNALHYAAYFDVAPLIRLLLRYSESKDYVDSRCSEYDDGTSLHISCTENNYNASRALLDCGANPHLTNRFGKTPLDVIPEEDEDIDSETALLRKNLRRMLMESAAAFQIPKFDTPTYEGICGKVLLMQLGFELGEDVITDNKRIGVLKYLGTTEFSKGIWAGIELSNDEGKHSGSVAGIQYFKAKPNHGLFVPVKNVRPLKKARHPEKPNSARDPSARTSKTTDRLASTNQKSVSKLQRFGSEQNLSATEHTNSYRPNSHNSIKSQSAMRTNPKPNEKKLEKAHSLDLSFERTRSRTTKTISSDGEIKVGSKVLVDGKSNGLIRFRGNVKFSEGIWYGVEFPNSTGKNDGSVNGYRYFKCPLNHGSFFKKVDFNLFKYKFKVM